MDRREFMGVASAVGLGGLLGKRMKGGKRMIERKWELLRYGTDLNWVASSDFPSSVGAGWSGTAQIGNGTANLAVRRLGDITFFRMFVKLGSTTVLPTGSGGWIFELPVYGNHGFLADSTTDIVSPVAGVGYVYQASSGNERPGPIQSYRRWNGSYPALVCTYTDGDGIMQRPAPGFPWTWATGDILQYTGSFLSLDN